MRTCAVFLMAAVTAGGALAQQLEFKGVPFGASIEQFKRATNPEGTMCLEPDRLTGLVTCRTHGFTFANQKTEYTYGLFKGGRMVGVLVNFFPANFDDVALAIAEKYGKPSRESAPQLTTRSGATLQGKNLDWFVTGGAISLIKYNDRIDLSAAHFTTPEGLDAANAPRNPKKAKKDI